jgi:hypothetical protein
VCEDRREALDTLDRRQLNIGNSQPDRAREAMAAKGLSLPPQVAPAR